MAAVLLLMVVGTGTALAQQSGKTITGKVLDDLTLTAKNTLLCNHLNIRLL